MLRFKIWSENTPNLITETQQPETKDIFTQAFEGNFAYHTGNGIRFSNVSPSLTDNIPQKV